MFRIDEDGKFRFTKPTERPIPVSQSQQSLFAQNIDQALADRKQAGGSGVIDHAKESIAIIEAGDNPSAIAQSNGITLAELEAANQGVFASDDLLRPNEVIFIPQPDPAKLANSAQDSQGIPSGEQTLKQDLLARSQLLQLGTANAETGRVIRLDIQSDVKAYLSALPADEQQAAAIRLLGDDADWSGASAARLAVRDATIDHFASEIYGQGNKVEYADSPGFDHKAETARITANVTAFLQDLPESDRYVALQTLYNRDWRDAGPAKIAIEQAALGSNMILRESKYSSVEMDAAGFAEGLYKTANQIEYADAPGYDFKGSNDQLALNVQNYIAGLPEVERSAALQYLFDRNWTDAGPGQVAIETTAQAFGITLRASGHSGSEAEAVARTILDEAKQADTPADIIETFTELSKHQPDDVLAALKANPEAVAALAQAENRDRVDKWLESQDIDLSQDSEQLSDILRGTGSDLAGLNEDGKKYLLDRLFDQSAADLELSGLDTLAQLASQSGDASLRSLIAERLAAQAAKLSSPPHGQAPDEWDRNIALLFATKATIAAGVAKGPHEPVTDYTALKTALNALGPEQTAAFVQALEHLPANGAGPQFADVDISRNAILLAAGAPPSNATSSAAIQNIYAQTPFFSMALEPSKDGTPGAMALAVTREWYPDDSQLQSSEAARLQAIFSTSQGKELLFAGIDAEHTVPLETRLQALATIRADKTIDADTLQQTDDPWQNSRFIDQPAQDVAAQYFASRGNEPITLTGNYLDNTVGTAMGLQPAVPEGMSGLELQQKVANGEISLFAGDDHTAVQTIVASIRAIGGDAPAVTIVPVQYSSSQTGPISLPLFRIDTASGSKFVDNQGRTYNDFNDWKSNNQLPPGVMIYPKDGRLTQVDGTMALSSAENTPQTPDSFGEHVKQVIDVAALVGGIAVGTLLIFGSAGTATPFVVGAGVAFAGWGTYRASEQLVDRAQHGQDINPITNEDARMLWLDGVSSLAGIAAFASTAKLASIAAKGGTLTPRIAQIIGTTRAVSNIADTGAISNMAVYAASNWNNMSAQDQANTLLAMGFWGVTMGMNSADLPSAGGIHNLSHLYDPLAQTTALLKTYNIPATENGALAPGTIRMLENPPGSGMRSVEYAPGSAPEDISIHRRLAILDMQEASIRGLLGDKAPAMGTPAGQLYREDLKTSLMVARLEDQLADPKLTVQQRTQIQADIVDRMAILTELTNKVRTGDISGLYEIYQRPVGREIAQQNGPQGGYGGSAAEALDNYCLSNKLSRDDYNFRFKPNSTTEVEIYRISDSAPRLEITQNNGHFTVAPKAAGSIQSENGQIAEHYVRVELEAQGYEVFTIQNASGNGVDVFGIKDNELLIGEVKANSATLSKEQVVGGETFALSRLQKAADGDPPYANLNAAQRQQAEQMLNKVLGLDGYEIKPVEINVQLTPDGDVDFVRHRPWNQSPENDAAGAWEYDENF